VKKIRLGFVGAGYMGQLAHMSNYALLEDCEIIALAEPRPQLAGKVAARYGIKEVYANHLELLENCEVDGIVAAQPYTHHHALVPDILNAGMNLLTEKPLALSVEAGEMLADLADKNKVTHMVGYHKRSDPAMEYAKSIIDQWKESKEYGKMRYIRITMPPGDWIGGAGPSLSSDEPYPPIKQEPEMPYFDKETAGLYNSFVNYYIHQVNAMRFILGENYRVTYADKSGVLMAVESISGICGVIEMAPYNNTVDWEESILVAFEKGYVRIDLPQPLASQLAGTVTIMRDNGNSTPEKIRPSMPRISAMRRQAMNYVSVLKGECRPPCGSREALEDLKTAKEYITLFCGQ
jgi:predicted dehydrogenase